MNSKEKLEEVEKGNSEALKRVLNTVDGRQVLYDIIAECGIYRDIAGNSDTVFSALGSRRVGLKLLAKINSIDEKYHFDMMLEARNRETEGFKIKKGELNGHRTDDTDTRSERDIYDNGESEYDIDSARHESEYREPSALGFDGLFGTRDITGRFNI